MTVSFRRITLAVVCAFAGVVASAFQAQAPQRATAVAVDNDDIGGIVTSATGPEAGVWVIAETNDLGTRFARIVVTDDQGRYLIPDLPAARYTVWVRGRGSHAVADGRRQRKQAARRAFPGASGSAGEVGV